MRWQLPRLEAALIAWGAAVDQVWFVWRASPPVQEQPEAVAAAWQVHEVAPQKLRLYCVFAHSPSRVRFTTPLQDLQRGLGQLRTSSGRVYRTSCPPIVDGPIADLLRAWAQLTNGATEDVSEDVWRVIRPTNH